MPFSVELVGPGRVECTEHAPEPMQPGTVRVATWYSGISAGTEMTTYRGTNPYLAKHWDAELRMFSPGEPAIHYPVGNWGYSEVGQVVDRASGVTDPELGDLVWGMWGHRSEAVLDAAVAASRVWRLAPSAPRSASGPDDRWAVRGVFARLGAVALNSTLAAEPHLGEHVAIFGQGVIGLLATQLTLLSGGRVWAVDPVASRLDLAAGFGATVVSIDESPDADVAVRLRSAVPPPGLDVAIELSGSYRALQQAIRSVGPDSTVVAGGFYQGQAADLALGEEFHHNRVRLLGSQIGGVPASSLPRWSPDRLHRTFMALVAQDAVQVDPLVSHILPAAEAQHAFEVIDSGGPDVLQVVLAFDPAPTSGNRHARGRDR